MVKDDYENFVRSLFWEVTKQGMIDVLRQAAPNRKERGVFHYALHTIYVQDEGICIVPRNFSDEIFLFWDALLSIRYNPAEGDGSAGTLTFRMFYGSLTIMLEGIRDEGPMCLDPKNAIRRPVNSGDGGNDERRDHKES